jgi:outer membrane protein insertion porin family
MHRFWNFARRASLALVVAVAMPLGAGVLSLVTAETAAAVVAQTITVRGNQRVDASTIRTYMTIKTGANYAVADLDASQKALFNTGLFSDVSVVSANGGGTVVVTVIENPVVNSVTFANNSAIKSDILATIVTLQARGVLTDAKLRTDVARIKEYYSIQGRARVNVTPQVTRLVDNRANVQFVIDEGARVGVSSLEFVNNNAFPSQRLRSVINTRKTSWLSWFDKRDVYSPERLQADQDALRRFYLQRGYADFQILSVDATTDANGNYHVVFVLDEGQAYTFGNINVDSSISGLSGANLSRSLKTRSGAVFNASEVESSVEALTIELSRQGYVFAQVRPRGDRDYANHIVSITYVIDEGPRAYIERIEIRGNTKTRDYVIRREFDIAEGDAYNRVLIDKAQRRLRNLGYFKTVEITPQQGSAPDRVVVVVTVEDQSTGSFSVAGGVSTTEGLIAELSLEESNFLGRGQAVRLAVSGGSKNQSYSFSFTDPYFLGYRVAAGFDVYKNVSKPTSFRPFTTNAVGGGVRLGLPLNEQWRADLNYKYDNTEISGASTTCGGLTISGCYFPNGTRVTSSAGYALTYSTIDSYVDPHQGLFVKLRQDFAGLGGTANYIRTIGDARVYRPIGTKTDIVGLARVQGGNITGLGQPVAIADNFFKGGETIRGFGSLGYGPRDATAGATDAGVAVGGKNFAVASVEVQSPIPFIPPDFGLKAAAFFDAGVLYGVDIPAVCGGGACTVQGANDTAVRTSVGASILWASPFGPLRVDFAQALSKQSYDRTEFIRFGAGSSF